MVAPSSARVAKWKRWLKVLDNEVTTIYFHRAVWQEIAKAIDENAAIPRTPALSVLQSMCAAAQAMAVRRVAHGGPNDVAFDTLLNDIGSHAVEITRDWWLSHYEDEWGKALGGYRDWANNFAGREGSTDYQVRQQVGGSP